MIILEEYAAAIETALSPVKGRCRVCGEERAAAMQNRDQICYRCDHRQHGLPEIEEHHLFGGHKGIYIDLPLNEHRVLDAMRLSRPPYLQEPGGNLLVNAVQVVLLVSEVAILIADHSRRHAGPQWVVTLAEVLTEKAREAAEALLYYGGHVAECPNAQWHNGARKWKP